MDTHSHKFKLWLGIFIIGGMALFIFTIFIIGKQKNLFNPVFKVTANFYNVSGLQVGNNIRFSGINVGTVEDIRIINDSTVQVEMLIRKEIQQFIKTDCKVAIGSEGIIGDRVLIISQGGSNSPVAKNGQHLASMEPVETDAIMASLKVAVGNTEVISKELSEILVNVNSGHGPLGRLIRDSLMGESINQTLVSFNRSSNGLNRNIGQITQILDKVNQGEGPLGRLIQDTVMGENINQTIIHLKNSSQGFEENMEALKDNFLLKSYYKKKAKQQDKEIEKQMLEDLENLEKEDYEINTKDSLPPEKKKK